MTKAKKILVFTGGGLAPALNSALYGVINRARFCNYKIYGGMYGWNCLEEKGKIVDFNHLDVEPIRKVGGTLLRSSRTNPLKNGKGILQVKKKIKDLGITHIVAIGGDDTLGAAKELYEQGVPIVGIPKTVDNDLSSTYWTIGFPTAAHYLINFVKSVRIDAAYALSRIFIIETLGQKVGWLVSTSAYAHADVIVPPERQANLSKVFDLLDKAYKRNGNFACLTISEEANFDKKVFGHTQAVDQYGIKRKSFVALALRDLIQKELGVETKVLFPGNYLQSGCPTRVDRDFARRMGRQAVDLIKEDKLGQMSCLIRPNKKTTEIKVASIPLSEAVGEGKRRCLNDNLFDFENYKIRKAYLDYLEPILGKYYKPTEDYFRLIKKLNNS